MVFQNLALLEAPRGVHAGLGFAVPKRTAESHPLACQGERRQADRGASRSAGDFADKTDDGVGELGEPGLFEGIVAGVF
jgi:hypothetical protein